jgi:hypothetical protein
VRIQAAVAAGRHAAESLMTDSCTITAVTATVTDDLSGQVVQQTRIRYLGRCRVQAPDVQGLRLDVGEVSRVVLRLQLQVPVAGTELVARGDQVLITVSPGDSALVGRTFVVRDLAHKSHATSRRLSIEEVT